MLGRGKIPLEERKIQVERGEEIDAIWKKNNPKQMGDPNPQKKTQNKRVSQTQLKKKKKKTSITSSLHNLPMPPLPPCSLQICIYIAFQSSWWACFCFSFHSLLSFYAHHCPSHKLSKLHLCSFPSIDMNKFLHAYDLE